MMEASAGELAALSMDEAYERRGAIAGKVREYYRQRYSLLAKKMRPIHLKPIIDTLLESENIVLQQSDELIENLRIKVLKQLLQAFDSFWDDHFVNDSIIALEMLKDKFKEFEGIDWNITNKTPQERIMPIHMQFKERMGRHLEKQLEYQRREKEALLKENSEWRACMKKIELQRVYIREYMDCFSRNLYLYGVHFQKVFDPNRSNCSFEENSDME